MKASNIQATSTTRAVFRVFWQHVRRHKLYLFIIIPGVFISEIGNDLVLPWVYKLFVDALVNLKSVDPVQALHILLQLLIWIFIFRFIVWIAYRISATGTQEMSSRVMAEIEQSSFRYLIGHSYQFFTNTFTGSLARRISRLSRAYDVTTDTFLFEIIPLVLSIIGGVVIIGTRSHLIAGLILLWILVFAFVNYRFSLWKLKYDAQRAEKDSESTAVLSDVISNSVNVKLFSGYADENRRYSQVTNELSRIRRFTWRLADINTGIQWLFMIFIEFGVMYFAIGLWSQGKLTVGDFVLFQGYLGALFARLNQFGRLLRNLNESVADAKEMVDILQTPYDIQDKRRAKPLVVSRGKIEFKDVIFNYSQTRRVLDEFNLMISPREKVALVGSSGAGKSTVVKLLFRFYDVDRGKILIDGQSIADVTQESLRNAIALVPQDPILFHRTLKENIRYGRRDATDAEVIAAAKKAHAHEFIQQAPHGYDTFVGERGIKLSGGERQRVAIARAILKNAPILVLDEATSSLDSESESLIQDALRELMKNKTVIVIAHRLSTIMQMDRIIVVQEGKVVDTGTHDELLQKVGVYQKLWNIQAGGFEKG